MAQMKKKQGIMIPICEMSIKKNTSGFVKGKDPDVMPVELVLRMTDLVNGRQKYTKFQSYERVNHDPGPHEGQRFQRDAAVCIANDCRRPAPAAL